MNPQIARLFDLTGKTAIVTAAGQGMGHGIARRLAKDFEQTIASATAWLFIASIQTLTRRITRS